MTRTSDLVRSAVGPTAARGLALWMVCCGLGCVSHVVAPAPPRLPGSTLEISDAALDAAVRRELQAAPALEGQMLQMVARDGVIVLEGVVTSLLARRAAEFEAKSVRGVRAVVNRLEVRPATPRSDEQLERLVADALRADPVSKDEDIAVRVTSGIATLSGSVQSRGEVELAQLVASSVEGLRGVETELKVDSLVERSDADLQHEIERMLRWDALTNSALIRVQVERGRVQLTGTVGSAAERDRVADDAWVRGVREVDASAIEVAWWARDAGRRAVLPDPDDGELERAIRGALLHDPEVGAYAVQGSVPNFWSGWVWSGS